MSKPSQSSNPAVRIVAHQTSPNQPDSIERFRIKMHAGDGSIDVDSVDKLLEDAVDDGELKEVAPDRFAVAE